jgi:hypothetical protein
MDTILGQLHPPCSQISAVTVILIQGISGFWTLSIVRCLKEHDVSETGYVSVLR